MAAILAALMLTTAACLLGSTAQEDYKPSRQIPIILSDTCLPEEQLSERAAEDGISETLGVIAPTLAAGRAIGEHNTEHQVRVEFSFSAHETGAL